MSTLVLLIESTVMDIEKITLFRHSVTGEYVLKQGDKSASYVSADDAQDMYVEWLTNAIGVTGCFK